MTVQDFLADLTATGTDDDLLDFCRKRVLHGNPYVFLDRDDEFYEFRKRIACEFNVSFHQIFVTGSAKLGFSAHKKTEFSYDSDVDIAIVSQSLFDNIMGIISDYQMELRRARRTVSEQELQMYHSFLEYSAIGWIRPDKLPISFKVGQLKKSTVNKLR